MKWQWKMLQSDVPNIELFREELVTSELLRVHMQVLVSFFLGTILLLKLTAVLYNLKIKLWNRNNETV